MTARIDVVIPVRDVDRYLGEALDSALDQQVASTVVVVDAGSVIPVRLPDRHADRPEVRLLRSEEPLLAGAARTLGVASGTSAWLSFLDADDVWPTGSRAVMLEAAEAEGADVVVGTVEHFASDAASAARLQVREGRQRGLLAGGVLLRRELWERTGPFDPALRAGEFVDWFARVVASGARIIDVPELALRRRVHLASTTAVQTGRDDRSAYLEVVRRWMRQNGS